MITIGADPRGVLERLLIVETDDCIEWPLGRFRDGYGSIEISGRTARVHVVACERRHGPKPTPKHEAAHSCANPPCLNPRHLRWATRRENELDKIDHGTTNRGERHGRHKLTAVDVVEIRERCAAGAQQKDLAAEYGVTQPTISRLVSGKRWSHL